MSALAADRASQNGRFAAPGAAPVAGTVSSIPDAARFGSKPTARQAQDTSMASLSLAQSTGALTGKTGRVSTGLGTMDATRFGGPVTPATPASSLRTSPSPTTSPNYGVGFAANARQAQDVSMGALHDYDKEVVGVTKAGPGWTQVTLRDGTVETRNGTRASRNNNPGNIEAGDFARSMGAVGTDGRFAVFSSPAQGLKAMESLVFDGKGYRGKTVAQAIGRYAPPSENNTARYAAEAAAAAGVSVNTKLSDMTPAQRSSFISGMVRVEGGKPYSTTTEVAGNPRGTPAGQVRSQPAQTQTATAGTTGTATAAAPASDRFASNYLGNVPTPTSRPADAPKPERSLPDKVLSGAIDVGVGMIPGIGTVAGLYGLAAPLMGMPTIGDMALNIRDTNQFDLNASLAKPRAESGASGRPAAQVQQGQPQAAAPAQAAAAPAVAAFEAKYLGFSDPTPRLTPEQKWGGIGPSSVPYTL